MKERDLKQRTPFSWQKVSVIYVGLPTNHVLLNRRILLIYVLSWSVWIQFLFGCLYLFELQIQLLLSRLLLFLIKFILIQVVTRTVSLKQYLHARIKLFVSTIVYFPVLFGRHFTTLIKHFWLLVEFRRYLILADVSFSLFVLLNLSNVLHIVYDVVQVVIARLSFGLIPIFNGWHLSYKLEINLFQNSI